MKHALLLLCALLVVPVVPAHAALARPHSAVFRDQTCDVLYTDWFYTDPNDDSQDCSASDIKRVGVDYTANHLIVTVTYAGMVDSGLARIDDLEVNLDTSDPNSTSNFRLQAAGIGGAGVFRGSYGIRKYCQPRVAVTYPSRRGNGNVRMAVRTNCLRKANGGSVPSRVRLKVYSEAEENECPPADCTDDWDDWLDYPNDGLTHRPMRWTSYVYRP